MKVAELTCPILRGLGTQETWRHAPGIALLRSIHMRNLASLSFLLTLTAMLVGASTSTAHAYLDPGTGSITPSGPARRSRRARVGV